MRTHSAILALLAACLLAAPAWTDNPSPTTPPPEARLISAPALALNARRDALEKKILAHLSGQAVSTFAELKQEFDAIKDDVRGSQQITVDERAALAELLLRDERLLTGGAALARGAGRLDPRLEKILAAAAARNQSRAAAAVDSVIQKLLSAAADPAKAGQVFDNLRARLGSDPAVAQSLDAVKLDFGQKAPIAYTAPSDPLYKLTNHARLSRPAVVPPITTPSQTTQAPAPEAAPQPQTPPADPQEVAAIKGCEEATNGSWGFIQDMCGWHFGHIPVIGYVAPTIASAIAGFWDAIKQQFGTVEGIVTNIIFFLVGVVMGLLTGGAWTVIKLLMALGMGAWAAYKLVPAFIKAIKDLWDSKDGTVERYLAVRQLAGLVGGVLIMVLLAWLGGKAGKAIDAKLPELNAKYGANLPGPASTMMAKFAKGAAERAAPPALKGAAQVSQAAPGKAPPAVVQNAAKGFVVVAEDANAGAKTSSLSRVVQKTVAEHLESRIKPGESLPAPKARAILAEALAKANDAVTAEAAKGAPGANPRVNLALGIVAKDASGAEVLVSANAGKGGIFLQRAGEIAPQRGAPPVLERFAAVRKALKADGIEATDRLTAADLKRASGLTSNLRRLAADDPTLQAMLTEAENGGRRLAARASSNPAWQGRTPPEPGLNLLEYKARVAAEPAPGEALGSPGFKLPSIREVALKPGDNIFAASAGAAADAATARARLPKGAIPDEYFRELVDGEGSRAPNAEPRAVARLSVLEKPSSLVPSPNFILNQLLPRLFSPLQPPPPQRIVFLPPDGPTDPTQSGPCQGPNCSPTVRPPGSGGAPPRDLELTRTRQPQPPADTGCVGDDCDQSTTPPTTPPGPTTTQVAGGNGPSGGQKGGSNGGDGDKDKHSPALKAPGGFGDKGGGGDGGAGGGTGADGNGAHGGSNALAGGGGVPPVDAAAVAAPPNAVAAPFAPAAAPAAKLASAQPAPGAFGGHAPEPSVASRFDGSVDRSRTASAWSPTPLRGLPGGDSPPLPRLGATGAAAPTALPAAADGLKDAKSAGAVPIAPGAPLAPAPAAPKDEDYNYTYMAPARERPKDLPDDRPLPSDDWRYYAWLGTRASLSLAAAYLLLHSDLGYLVGLSRRRRG